MTTNVSLLVCFFFLVFQNSCLGHDLRPPLTPNCTRPGNTVPLKLAQLSGVWYIHQIVNSGSKQYDMACTRIEYLMRADKRSVIEVENFFSKTTGQFTPDNYELTQVNEEIIQLHNLRDKSFKLYYYALKFDGRNFVVSVCFTQNGNYLAQPIAILTTNKTEDPNRLEDELKSAGVDIKDSYTVPQDENCFKYEAPV